MPVAATDKDMEPIMQPLIARWNVKLECVMNLIMTTFSTSYGFFSPKPGKESFNRIEIYKFPHKLRSFAAKVLLKMGCSKIL